MAITWVSHTTDFDKTSAPAYDYPTEIQSGDLLLLWQANSSTTPTVTSHPSGFTLAYEINSYYSMNRFWYRWADGTETGSVSISMSAGHDNSGGMICLRGCVGSGNPIDTYDDNYANNATATYPTITPSVDNCMILAFCMTEDDVARSTISGYTEEMEATWNATNPDFNVNCQYKLQTTKEATGAVTSTTVASEIHSTVHMAILPEVEAGGTTYNATFFGCAF